MTKLDPAHLASAMKVLLANQAERAEEGSPGMGEPTDLKCYCGGVMHRFDPIRAYSERFQKEIGRPRYSRRKRQAKKNYMKWKEAQGFKAFLAAATRPLRNPMGFRCGTCGSHQGFYGMMARSMFKIEPLPQGAKEFY